MEVTLHRKPKEEMTTQTSPKVWKKIKLENKINNKDDK
jgi:hypothetical protein